MNNALLAIASTSFAGDVRSGLLTIFNGVTIAVFVAFMGVATTFAIFGAVIGRTAKTGTGTALGITGCMLAVAWALQGGAYLATQDVHDTLAMVLLTLIVVYAAALIAAGLVGRVGNNATASDEERSKARTVNPLTSGRELEPAPAAEDPEDPEEVPLTVIAVPEVVTTRARVIEPDPETEPIELVPVTAASEPESGPVAVFVHRNVTAELVLADLSDTTAVLGRTKTRRRQARKVRG